MTSRDGDREQPTGDRAEAAPVRRRDVLQGLVGGALAVGLPGAVRGGSLPGAEGRGSAVGMDTGHRDAVVAESLSVETGQAVDVGQETATLQGTLQSLGGADSADVGFEYGVEGAEERQGTATETLDATGEFEIEISGLDPGTTYAFAAVATTASASDSGEGATFTTGKPPLTVETGEAVEVGQETATLRGEVLETGGAETVAASVEYWVEGEESRQETLARTLSAPGSFEIAVDGLAPETTYRFRALAATDGGSDAGEEATFTTATPPLAVQTGGASDVGQREATLSGEVTELGVADEGEAFFEYWIDCEGDGDPQETTRESIDAAGAFDQQVAELEPGTTYAFRAAAETPEGSDRGAVGAFMTEHLPLSVQTGTASDVGPTSATLSGEVLELGAADTATVAFEYWADEGDRRRETAAEALSAPDTVEAELTDLRQDTGYAFRALADSGVESNAGEPGAFATPVEPVSRPTVDRTDVDTATFSQWGEGYRIRAAGTSPWQRPRDRHGYGAIYGETEGDVVVQTTLAGLRGEHDLRLAGLVVTNDILAGGGLDGDLLLAVEPDAGVSLAVYDPDRREYGTVGSAGPPDVPVDLRLTKRDGTFVAEYRRAVDRAWQPVGSVDVPAASFTQHVGVFATGGHDADRCVADFAEFLLGETGVSLLPAARTIAPGMETTFDLVVENADRGIRSYAATLAVPEPDLLRIEDVDLLGEPVFGSVDLRPDGSQATIEAGMGENAHDAGDVAIAEVTVRTRAEGSLTVAVPEVTVVDDGATIPYDVASVDGADVTIAADAGPPPVVGDDPPRDLDGDGLYRDINGDGTFTVSDVQALFEHRRDDVVLNNAEYFNFAGDDPPDVSLADVQALFQDLLADDPGAAAALGLEVEKPADADDISPADLRRALSESP